MCIPTLSKLRETAEISAVRYTNQNSIVIKVSNFFCQGESNMYINEKKITEIIDDD